MFYRITIFFVLFYFTISLSFGQFLGGAGNGHSNINLTGTDGVCSIASGNFFLGGQADGHSNVNLTGTDGVCSITTGSPYAGGQADGHSNVNLTGTDGACSILTGNPYAGGQADGHSNINLTGTDGACFIPTGNPYIGGQTDGYSSLSIIGTGGPCEVPMPIELLSFTAACNNGEVLLKWTTASEQNNSFFQIEKSSDALNYDVVGTVQGAGNSSGLLHYSFVDADPLQGTSYYRLRQTDFNGTTEVFFPVAVSCVGFPIVIYPTIGSGLIAVQTDQKVNILIYNMLGEKIYSSTRHSNSLIDLTKQADGMYLVEIKTDNKTLTQKIVVAR